MGPPPPSWGLLVALSLPPGSREVVTSSLQSPGPPAASVGSWMKLLKCDQAPHVRSMAEKRTEANSASRGAVCSKPLQKCHSIPS